MAYDLTLAQRARDLLADNPAVTEKQMFGGLAFLHEGRMFLGVSGSALMARVGPRQHADSLARSQVRPMDFTGRPMTGYVYVDPPALATAETLDFWVQRCLDFVMSLPPKPVKAARRARP